MTSLDALALDPALARHARDYQRVREAEKARRELRACVAEGVRVEGGERRRT